MTVPTLERLRKAGLPDRIVDRLRPEGDCLVWTGARNEKGYGMTWWNDRMERVHRLVFLTLNGPIPDGLCVLHHCDNPPCAAPHDLFLGTKADNNTDKARKGRSVYPIFRGEAHSMAKITQADVDQIRARYVKGHKSHNRGNSALLAVEYGITGAHVRKIVRGKNWNYQGDAA